MKVVSSWLRVRRDPRLWLGSESKIPEAAVKTLYRKELRSFFKAICPLHFFLLIPSELRLPVTARAGAFRSGFRRERGVGEIY
jgi:hypothetical protein